MEPVSIEIKDWSQLFANYRGQWVALADDEVTVIAAAPTARAALTASSAKGIPSPILYRVPDTLYTIVGDARTFGRAVYCRVGTSFLTVSTISGGVSYRLASSRSRSCGER